MIDLSTFATAVASALASAEARACVAIAAEVPPDVADSAVEGGVRLVGRALSVRALTDPRLRDFAAIARAR